MAAAGSFLSFLKVSRLHGDGTLHFCTLFAQNLKNK
jgi:hypothetical protein